MKIINPTDKVVFLAVKGGYRFEPGEVKDVPESVTRARRWRNGNRRPSIMEEYAPQLRPADDDEYHTWLQAPEATWAKKEPKLPDFHELVRQGYAPAVARQMVLAGIAAAQHKFEEDMAAFEQAKENEKVKKKVKAGN